MTARQAVQLAASLACAVVSTGVAFVAAVLAPAPGPAEED